MTDLSEILKNEAWLEGEKRGSEVSLSDPVVHKKALKIWNMIYSQTDYSTNRNNGN